ncbi:hypothetical protein [Escherichia coli]|uniref:hypothetical protein n=1 Tax=Escherichia coli TaxID=562 RepID=UPI00388F644B
MDLASLRATNQTGFFCDPRGIDSIKIHRDLIAGADVGFEQGGEVTRAAMVLLKYPSLELVSIKLPRHHHALHSGFFPSANILRCWQRGRCCRKSRI